MSLSVQQTFADRLRLLRESQGFTQQQMATVLNVSRSTYTRYENGSSAPSLELTRRIVQLLSDGDPRYLMQLSTLPDPLTLHSGAVESAGGLSDEEQLLVLFYRTLSEPQRNGLLDAFRQQSLENLKIESGK